MININENSNEVSAAKKACMNEQNNLILNYFL